MTALSFEVYARRVPRAIRARRPKFDGRTPFVARFDVGGGEAVHMANAAILTWSAAFEASNRLVPAERLHFVLWQILLQKSVETGCEP